MSRLTVLIPTHAFKVEIIGPFKDVPQQNASAPSTKLIELVVENVKEHITDIPLEFIIGLDHKPDVGLSIDYLKNLEFYAKNNKNIEITHVDFKHSDRVMTTKSATDNFYNLIDRCKTDYFMVWEHDWIFADKINQEDLKIWDRDIEMLRFNQHPNEPRNENELMWHDEKGLRTSLYSNNPFITSKEIWNSKYKDFGSIIPDWWGEWGGFIEGPINRSIKAKTLDPVIHLYGDRSDPPVVKHLNGQVWQ